jgi:hypothetical protein
MKDSGTERGHSSRTENIQKKDIENNQKTQRRKQKKGMRWGKCELTENGKWGQKAYKRGQKKKRS